MLQIGTKAPEFALQDKNGAVVTLSDLAGKKAVVYFYSKDNTSGCTKQALAFAAAYEQIKALGAEVVGISKDTAASHLKFAEKNDLPFILLADPEHQALEAYEVWQEKMQCGKKVWGTVRATYIISADGTVEHVWPKVKPEANAQDVIDYLSK